MTNVAPPMATPVPRLPARSVLVLVAAAMSIHHERACGLAFTGKQGDEMALLAAPRLEAAITHHQGVQRTIVALTFVPSSPGRLLWVVALPPQTHGARVRPLDAFPRFHGHDPCWGGRAWIHAFLLVSRATQIYPMAFERLFLPDPGPSLRSHSSRFNGSRVPVQAEVVRAGSTEELVRELDGRGFRINGKSLGPLEPRFASKAKAAFVVAFGELPVGDAQAGVPASQACILVEFPARRAAYPLAGSPSDLVLYVMGYVRPVCPAGWAQEPEVLHRFQSRFGSDMPDAFTRGLPTERIPCTVIRVMARTGAPPQDLWFASVQPPGIAYAQFVESLSFHMGVEWLVRVLLILGFSYLSGAAAGVVLFRKWHGYAALGLWNLLTIVALVVAARRLSSPPHRDGPCPRFASRAAAMGFCALFSAVFVALTVLAGLLLLMPLRT